MNVHQGFSGQALTGCREEHQISWGQMQPTRPVERPSVGDLVDRGPDSWTAKSWFAGPHAWERFALTIRSNHEKIMLAGLTVGERYGRRRLRDVDNWTLWRMSDGDWWGRRASPGTARGPGRRSSADFPSAPE